jgi:DNA-binding MarR family transcriptional regulator
MTTDDARLIDGEDPAGQADADAARLYAILFAIVLDAEKRLAAHLAAHDLTTPQFYVLKTLREQGGQMGIGQIARAHSLTNATMTGLVNRLEAGTPPLVTRTRDPHDGRAVTVALTDEGRRRFDVVQAALTDELRALFSLLPAAERRALLDDIARYVALLTGLSL